MKVVRHVLVSITVLSACTVTPPVEKVSRDAPLQVRLFDLSRRGDDDQPLALPSRAVVEIDVDAELLVVFDAAMRPSRTDADIVRLRRQAEGLRGQGELLQTLLAARAELSGEETDPVRVTEHNAKVLELLGVPELQSILDALVDSIDVDAPAEARRDSLREGVATAIEERVAELDSMSEAMKATLAMSEAMKETLAAQRLAFVTVEARLTGEGGSAILPIADWNAESATSLHRVNRRGIPDGEEITASVKAAADAAANVGGDAAAKAAKALDALADQVRMLTVPGDGEPIIGRPTSSLVDARIELTKAKRSVGDELTVTVRGYALSAPAIAGQEPKIELLEKRDWKMRLVRAGLRSEVAPALIFARADKTSGSSATSTDWKLSAAAVYEFRYHVQDPNNCGAVWNWMDPGFGIHLAGVDFEEGTDPEFGVGVNASLFDGLLEGGVGYNLAVSDDGLYYFVGIDLFSVFDQSVEARAAR